MLIKNPCKDINVHWEGYPTDKPCEICGTTPAKVEPRFGYITCDMHDWINPFRFQRIVEGLEPDPLGHNICTEENIIRGLD